MSGFAGFLGNMQTKQNAPSRRSVLIDMNVHWLDQGLQLLERLDDAAYATTPGGFAPHRAGAHLRHVIEFYRCFLEGLKSSHIDYDARRRDHSIENSRNVASAEIRSIIQSLKTHPELRGERIIWVRMEDVDASGVRDAFMESSISRELQILSSHTVHHFALIAMTLRMHGVEMEPDFGMAPSTLRYLALQGAEAA